jgi:sulfofructosephosphate aldolase
MVALDQRESLRDIFAEQTGGPPPDDETLRRFKIAAARRLSPVASAVLVDPDIGLEAIRASGARSSDCGLILAVDSLVQELGGPVTDTDLDPAIGPDEATASGASALKLLLLWRGPAERDRRASLVESFLDLCGRTGLASILEAIVRRPASTGDGAGWDREAAIIEAAAEMGAMGPDLYKAEVPFRGRAAPEAIEDRAGEITASLPCPWVVLSNGVETADFPRAVEAACRGGASGFLAGRAIWKDSIVGGGQSEIDDRLAEVAVPRLEALVETVDEYARPWTGVSAKG